MPRPRTEIGTYGKIKTKLISKKTKDTPDVWEADAHVRIRNGTTRRVRRRGPSGPAAERNLKKAITRIIDEAGGRELSGDARLSHVAKLWLADFAKKVQRGERAHKSLYDYTDTIDNHLIPRMGELACREAEHAGLCDETLKDIREKIGPAAAKRARTVLSGICGYAVRHKAMTTNPVRDTEALSRRQNQAQPIRVLEPKQRRDFLAKLDTWVREHTADPKHRLGPREQAWLDLPDIAETMLSTGVRIGEVLAISGGDVDPAECTVYVGQHLVRIARRGMVRVEGRKGGEPPLTLRYPQWSAPTWRRRKLESGGGAIFPTWNGRWEDPSNVAKRLRTAADAIGYNWLTSRVFRRTVGTHLGDADVASTAIGDQLGNTAEVVEIHYRRKRLANQATADALENLLGDDVEMG